MNDRKHDYWVHVEAHDIEHGLLEMARALDKIAAALVPPTPPPPTAVGMTLTVLGGQMSFTVDQQGTATVQFVDDHGDATAGPSDSVSGAPVVPVVDSDNAGVVSVGPGADNGGGSFSYTLTFGAEGSANLSVAQLTNSDGSPVTDAAGNAFALPAPVAVTVGAGPAAGMTLSVA